MRELMLADKIANSHDSTSLDQRLVVVRSRWVFVHPAASLTNLSKNECVVNNVNFLARACARGSFSCGWVKTDILS